MSSTTSFMPTTSSEPYDDGTLSASAALAWKFYAFGMLAIFVTGILGTVIYLGCFKLRKPAGSRGDIEANEVALNGTKSTSFNERKLAEHCDELTSSAPPSSSTTTLVSLPPKAYTAARGEGSPREPWGSYSGSYHPMSAPVRISQETPPHSKQ